MSQKTPRPYEELGGRIQDLRRAVRRGRGERLTQRELADAIGVAQGTVTAWERGYQRPEGDNLFALARELGVDVATLRDAAPSPPALDPGAPAPVPAASVYERIDAILALPTPPGILVLLMDALGTAIRAEAEREAQVAAQERAKAMRAAEEAARDRAGAMEPEEERGWFVERLSDELRDRIRRELETPPQTGGAAGRGVA
jgi:transcriptional regulator with XRE-family HTH domain